MANPTNQQNKDLNEQVQELKKQVVVLTKYMEEKKIQQITYPLDNASKQVLNNEL